MKFTRLLPRAVAALLLAASSVAAIEAVTVREWIVFPEGRGEDVIEEPSRVARLSDGTVAVADADGRKVVLLRGGTRKVIAARPTGLAAHEHILYVAESRRIRRFNAEGVEMPLLADGDVIDFSSIRGLAVDGRGNIYAADGGGAVVYVLSPDGLPMTVIGRGAEGAAELSGPTDVAVDRYGRVFVLDAGNDRVAIYTLGGHFTGQIGPFEDPAAITVDAAGIVYVADADEGRIQRFDAAARPMGAFGTRGRARGQFRTISDIDIASDGILRVVDASNRSLHELEWPSPEGERPSEVIPLSAAWEGVTAIDAQPIGRTAGGLLVTAAEDGLAAHDSSFRLVRRFGAGLKEAVAAVPDARGRLYVADRGAGEIRVYDENYSELFSFGRGSRIIFFRGGPGKLVRPEALAVSPKGILAIVDASKVEMFGPDGTYMASVGAEGDDPGEIEEPVGVAFDTAGAIYIADAGAGRLSKFDASGSYSGRMIEGLEPLSVSSDEEGRIYLLDRNGPVIRVYSSNLEELATIGIEGLGRGGLKAARRIVVVGDRLYHSRRDGVAAVRLDLPLPPPERIQVRGGVREAVLEWETPAVSYGRGWIVACGDRRIEVPERTARVTGLSDESEYSIRVAAVNSFGHVGRYSQPVTVRTSILQLPTPSGLVVTYETPEADSLLLRWRAEGSPLVAGYAVEAWTGAAFERRAVTTAARCALPGGTGRRFRIRAVADNGKEGPPSIEATHAAGEGADALIGSPALAAERFLAATAMEPNEPRAWMGLGEASERLERYAEASSAFTRARDLMPSDSAPRLALARLAMLRGATAEAAAELKSAESCGADLSTDVDYVYLRGALALAAEEYDTATRWLALAVAGAPTERNRSALMRAEEQRRLHGENRPRLEFVSVRMQPIFPALYKMYAGRPVGEAIVRNSGRVPLERVRLSAFIRGAMDFPSDTVIRRLDPGESASVPIVVELANTVLDTTEDDTKQVELRMTYYRSGEPVEVRHVERFRLYARTALSWGEPSRVAAFVTHRSPVVAEFARNSIVAAPDAPDAGNLPLRSVAILRASLAALGIKYQQDPVSPFARVSEELDAVDHVQLPEETLRTRAGDCDDLVVLLCALLENLGVRTMIADVPGHILFLIDSELPPESARLVADEDAWIEHRGSVWIPVEATMLEAPLVDALRAGAAAVSGAGEKKRLIEVGEAWGAYPPVTSLATTFRAAVSDPTSWLARAMTDDAVVRRRMAAALINSRVSGGESDTEAANRAGVTYARFGLLDEAEREFARDGHSAAALNNLGNVMAMRGRVQEAQSYYERALALAPEDEEIRANRERMKP